MYYLPQGESLQNYAPMKNGRMFFLLRRTHCFIFIENTTPIVYYAWKHIGQIAQQPGGLVKNTILFCWHFTIKE